MTKPQKRENATNEEIQKLLSEQPVRVNETLFKAQAILCQQHNMSFTSINPFYYFPYTLQEMIHAQCLLESLSLLETIKYGNRSVNARSILRKCLYTGYDFENWLPVLYAQQSKLNSYNEHPHSDSKSIQKQLTEFLRTHSLARNATSTFYQTTRIPQRSDSIKANRKYYPSYQLPLIQTPEFIFDFIFNDGHVFSNWEKTPNINGTIRLPRISPSYKRSKFVYELIYSKMQKLYFNPLTPDCIVHRNKLNQMFYFEKLDVLSKYYEFYTSDYFLSHIMESCKLSYTEILTLKEYISAEIFQDYRFISKILHAPFLNGFLPFDLYFRYELLLHSSLARFSSYRELKIMIYKGKCYVDTFCKKNSITPNCSEFLLNLEDTSLDITELETNIVLSLLENPYYNYYFSCRKSCSNDNSNIPLWSISFMTYNDFVERMFKN